MITTAQLTAALEQQLATTPHFVVHVEVSPSGKAIVEVDNDGHITLNDLTAINKGLRETFGDALDDLELEVSSPGAGRPFRVMRQYRKHTGRLVEVQLTDGKKLNGMLDAFDEQGIRLRIEHPSTIKGRPAKLDDEATAIPFATIKSTQATLKFN